MKIAEDSDFNMLKMLVDDHTNWKLEYNKGDDGTKVSVFRYFFVRNFSLRSVNMYLFYMGTVLGVRLSSKCTWPHQYMRVMRSHLLPFVT